jgi:hypothetical protein
MESLTVKKDKAIQMFENLIKQTNETFVITKKAFDKEIIFPNFIN